MPLDLSVPDRTALVCRSAMRHCARLGWAPRWALREGLDATVEWYAGYRDGTDVRALCEGQIERFVGQAPVVA